MKKSNKISLFYVITSLTLLLILVFGGVYGIYVSVGLSFIRKSAESVTGMGGMGSASNVSFGGTVNFEYSMVGIIVLSIALIILSIFDLVSLIRQILLFKQFKIVKTSKLEQNVEQKIKSKSSVIFFAVLVDVLSVVLGIVGIFLNGKSFAGNNYAWIFYVIDVLIIILSIMSIVFLIMKIRAFKGNTINLKQKELNDNKNFKSNNVSNASHQETENKGSNEKKSYDIDDFEYKLLKLKNLKNSKIITKDEYENIRKNIVKDSKLIKTKSGRTIKNNDKQWL